MHRLPLILLPLLLSALCLFVAACASTSDTSGSQAPQASGPVPEIMVLVDHRNDMKMTIISDAWMTKNGVPGEDYTHRRAAFYSQKLKGDNLKVKVVENRVAQGIWQALTETGFGQYSHSGSAPAPGGDVASSIEVTLPSGVQHLAGYPNMDQGERKAYLQTKLAFMDLYNAILQLQTVERMPSFHGTEGSQR